MKTRTPLVALAIACWLIFALSSSPALAQFAGHNFRGDFGLQWGSQPDPGWYLAALYLRYDADTLRDRNGDSVSIDPEHRGSVSANYSFMVFPGWTDNSFEIPTPRWTAYDARHYGLTLPDDVEMVTQERAYTSPIWYTP